MEDQSPQSSEDSIQPPPPSSTSRIFKMFHKLYTKQLKEADESSSDGLELKVKILQNWVEDLTEQNRMLVETVDDLESEALKRLNILESNLAQDQEGSKLEKAEKEVKDLCNDLMNLLELQRRLCNEGCWYLDGLCFKTITYEDIFGQPPHKFCFGQIETLCRELEKVKRELIEKENLISKYQKRIEELGSSIEEEKTEDCSKLLNQFFAKQENIRDQDRNVQPSVYRELENTRLQLTQVEKEVIQLKKKLKEAESSIKRLRSDLVASEKNAREMRAALTAEVAEKHDQILALRRETNQLEEQLRQADMQTHFKDDIIKELRKEVKVARSKETLVEVLGIKERSLTHLEQLTEQLEQKDQVISCLKQQLTEGTADLLYRVRQQVDWFTENVTQQCGQGNCSEEFKKCITTMLEELKESIECCNLNPTDTAELTKGSVKFVSALQKSLEKSKKDLGQSWNSISETVHEMNKMDLSPLVDQWKKGLCKQKSLQQKLQEIVRSIINITSSSNVNVESITNSMESLQCLLLKLMNELNSQPQGRSFTGWLKNLHSVVSELISKIQEISQVISDIRGGDEETHADLVCKMQQVDALQWDLSETLGVELRAYETLCRKEKAQKVKLDSLLATVLHHEEIWNQQITFTDDLMKEILRLSNNVNQNTTYKPLEDRSTHLQNLVTKISADIRKSLCDIEQRQNQVSHLELDLSCVMMVLESAQQEIEELSKVCRNSEEMRNKMKILLAKLKKQIANVLTKANNLVNTYSNTKQEFISSSERILQLRKEWEMLEQEVRMHWARLSKDFNKPPKTGRSSCSKICPSQEVLATCTQEVKKLNESLDSYFLQRQNEKGFKEPLNKQYKCLQKALHKEGAAIKKVKENVMDLKLNIKDRDKLTETQNKTICCLQNSLKRAQTEADQLRQTIQCLEMEKCEKEFDYNKKIQELETKVLKLQNSLKKYEEVHDFNDESLFEKLQSANLELASLVGYLHEDCRNANLKISELYDQLSDKEKNHQKAEGALKIVIANLKETINKEQEKIKSLENKLKNCKAATNSAQDKTAEALEKSLNESQKEVERLSKKIKCLESKRAEAKKDCEEQIKMLQNKICELQNEKKLTDDTSVCSDDDSLRILQNANLELAVLAGHLQEDCRNAESKLSELYLQIRENETKHHKSEAALQIVIANLKEVICKEKKRFSEIEKENSKLREKVKELEECCKSTSKYNQEALDKNNDYKKQVKCLSKQVSDLEDQLKNAEEKLCRSLQREKELKSELSSKDSKCKEEICKKQKEINELTKVVQCLTDRVSESKTELDSHKMKNCEAEVKLKNICDAYEELKSKEREKEAQVEKLQVALTQLSNKFVSRRLDPAQSQCVRHYQEECAKYEALYNTTSCKLRSKEIEVTSLKQELERVRTELDHVAMAASHQKEEDSCPFLMERVHQLSKELQVAHSCQNSYEQLLKDMREKCSRKEDEIFQLKSQIKQLTVQRDTVCSDLEKAQQEINRLRSTITRLEQNNAHDSSDQLRGAMYEHDRPHMQPNIELQREISTALTSQLRGVKQKLHATKHDYKLLQNAYEELSRKYTQLQRGERDVEQVRELQPSAAAKPTTRCRPCLAKSSKSVTYIKMPERIAGQDRLEYLAQQSKSWHKMGNEKDLDWRERKWKRKLQEVIRGLEPTEAMQYSSSSN